MGKNYWFFNKFW